MSGGLAAATTEINEMPTFAMKDNTSPRIHGSHAFGKLEIRGAFSFSGPQPVGVDGGVPQWVGDLLDANPDIQQIAVSCETGSSVVWSRIKAANVKLTGGALLRRPC